MSAQAQTPSTIVSSHKGIYGFLHQFLRGALIGMLIVTVTLVPIFGSKNGLDIMESFFESNSSTDVVSVSDPPEYPPGSPYDYWYAPPDSFGISETKEVNWSYFKALFLAHTDWMLEYKRYSYSSWTDGLDYLTIERTWNDSGFWKFNLILDVPVHVYSARFTFGIDLPCLNYVERDGHEVWINYTANNTEQYSVMFNWSDIASIPNLVITKGRTDDMFWFRFRRDNIPTGHYEFDPTFGNEVRTTSGKLIENCIAGGLFQMGATGGNADNITAYIYRTGTYDVKCALYDNSKNFVVNGDTEEKSISSTGWHTFNFIGTKPILIANANYYIVAWSESTGSLCGLEATTGANNLHYETHAYNGFPASISLPSTLTNRIASIYASYTEGAANTAPTIAGEIPANTSTSISLTPVCNITANDADGGDTLTVTFYENTTDSWVLQQKNTSVSPGGNVEWDDYSNAVTASTKYWWKVHVDDATDNVSEIYYFTTAANESWQTVDATINGSYSNTTIFRVIDSTINGSYTNTTVFQIFDNTINGSYSNLTVFQVIDAAVNGSYFNATIWQFIDIAINGSYANTTILHAPTQSDESPTNQSAGIDRWTACSITASDLDGDSLTVYFYENTTGNWVLQQTNSSHVANTSAVWANFTNASSFSTTYYWSVNITDGTNWCNETYHFTTKSSGTVFTGTNIYAYYQSQQKLARQSNGTLWCTFHENSNVRVAWSEDNGTTWTDYEVCGVQTSNLPSIAVDSNDVVHLVFQSNKNDVDDYQLEYTNSTDWATIVQIRDEDKNHMYPSIAVDSNDNLHVVYEKGEEGTSNDDQVAYINSMNNGGSWGTEKILTNEVDAADDVWLPSIAIDNNNVIHVVFSCKDHYNGYDDILHMQSSDYGVTWSNWTSDPIYQDSSHDQLDPCVVIDDNDKLHVVWRGYAQYTTSQVAYSHNDSSSWSNVEWITWDPTVSNVFSSVSINDNNYVHCITQNWQTTMNHSVNDTTSWSTDTVLTGEYRRPNLIGAQHPTINGLKTNRPKTGYAFICAYEDTNITYVGSNDLTWDTATVWQITDSTINGSYTNSTTWNIIDTTINGSYVNITSWSIIDSTVNGSYVNSTNWQTLDSTINGSYYNDTLLWSNIDNTINGSYINTTVFYVIDSLINGSYTNVTNWSVFDNTINGSYSNTSGTTWQIVTNTINGSYSNITLSPSISNEYPSNQSTNIELNPTLNITVSDSDLMNITWSTNATISESYFGTYEVMYGLDDSVADEIWGLNTSCGYNATAESIIVRLQNGGDKSTRCGLYYGSNNTYLGGTEIKDSTNMSSYYYAFGGYGYYQFNFTNPKPRLQKDEYYWIVVTADGPFGSEIIWDFTDTQTTGRLDTGYTYDGTFPNSISWQTTDTSSDMSIYCTITPDEEWNTIGVNTSVGSGTYEQVSSSFTEDLKQYYWRVNVTDGSSWTNETYHFTTTDTTEPTIVINFAGNLSDSGGPYLRPPGDPYGYTYKPRIDTRNGITALVGEFSDGYYTNGSKQSESWVYINCTITDNSSVDKVYLHWYNITGVTWINTTELVNTVGDYWEINTSGHMVLTQNNRYSFDIWANDTSNNDRTVMWAKSTGLGTYGTENRRSCCLNCTTEYVDYDHQKVYYMSDIGATGICPYDRLPNDQGGDGTSQDTGLLKADLPSDAMHEKYCSGFVGYWFGEPTCVPSVTIENMYAHFWYVANVDEIKTMWKTSRMEASTTIMIDEFTWHWSDNITDGLYFPSAQGSSKDYYGLISDVYDMTDTTFTENDIYEFVLIPVRRTSGYPTVICNRSILSYVIFNIPDNASLQLNDTDSDGLNDWEEIYIVHTHPFLSDTDNDGVSDRDENLSGSDPNKYTDTTPYVPWNVIDSTINGSYSNTTLWTILDQTINGSYTNTSVSTWQFIDTTINGSYANTTTWQNIDITINGSYYNITIFQVLDSSINGSYYNLTIFQVIDSTINGSYTNVSTSAWTTIDSTINGSYINTTVINWQVFDSTINGSYTNITIFRVIDSAINGSYVNTTVISWEIIDSTVNGSYYNDTEIWQTIDISINGSYVNTTNFIIIDNAINGSYYNDTITWQTITILINGSYSNTTIPWNNINNTINGSYTNISTGDIEACFTYNVAGANIYATSCSKNTNSNTCYKWESSDDGTNYASTGWICDTRGETFIFTYPEGGNICMRLTVKNDEDEDTMIQCIGDMQSNKDIYNPDHYNARCACEDAGYYWYDDDCHKDPKLLPWNVKEPLPEAGDHDRYMINVGEWKIHWIYLVLAGMALLIILTMKKKKKKRY